MNIQETVSTLKFVQRAKQIKNKAIINENVSGSLKSLQEEVKKLKEELLRAGEIQCKNCSHKALSTGKNTNYETSCLKEDNNSLFNKEEIKELCSKIEILLNYEKALNV